MLAEPTSFEVFLNYAYPITQMSYWVIVSLSAIVAVVLFKRLVDAQARTTGEPSSTASAAGRAPAAKPAAKKDVSIDEFVD